ncbi:MAG: hypothetical protein ACMG6E_04135, partial [Candidatus Roizmanbacteria bacterium]
MNHIPESEATGDLKNLYESIKRAYGTHSLPIFFSYIGPYLQYLSYIGEQLIKNLQDPQFIKLTEELEEVALSTISDTLQKPELTQEFIKRYSHSSSFTAFQKDLQTIFRANIKLTITFLALRESVKGWALATKKLPGQTSETQQVTGSDSIEKTFIIDNQYQELVGQGSSNALAQRDAMGSIQVIDNGLDENIL